MLELLITTIILGVATAGTAKQLDFWMDYGHVLGGLRMWRARRSAKKQGRLEEFDGKAVKRKELFFPERVSAFDRLYWELTAGDKGLTPWLCVKCLCGRISLVVGIAMLFFFGFSWVILGAAYLQMVIAFIVLQKL